MAYNQQIADRLRKALARKHNITEQKMFGGIAFMVRGHMCCGVLDDHIVLRLGNEGVLRALELDHTRPMDFTGKVIKSMIYVEPAGFADDALLKKWLDKALRFVRSLPAKTGAAVTFHPR